jgi:hypothetical protein
LVSGHESVRALTVPHRTTRTKNCVTRSNFLGLVFKLVQEAEKSWRRIQNAERIAERMQGVVFADGEPVKEQDQEPSGDERGACQSGQFDGGDQGLEAGDEAVPHTFISERVRWRSSGLRSGHCLSRSRIHSSWMSSGPLHRESVFSCSL